MSSLPMPCSATVWRWGPCLRAATYSVVFKKLSSRYGVLTLTALQAFVGTLFFAPSPSIALACGLGLAGHGVILFLGAFVTLGAYLLYNWSVAGEGDPGGRLCEPSSHLCPAARLSAAGETLGLAMGCLRRRAGRHRGRSVARGKTGAQRRRPEVDYPDRLVWTGTYAGHEGATP